MNREEFKMRLAEWLEAEGLAVSGIWDLENTEDENTVNVSVRIKIQSIDVVGHALTENKEETIRTTVLNINDQLISKIASVEY